MATLEEYLSQATAPGPDRQLTGCVVMAANKDGIAYSKSFGSMSVDPTSHLYSEPLTPDTTMWIASNTKLMTAISALQCVERGLLSLDDDVSNILEEWKAPEILVGFEDDTGKPIVQKAKNKITLRLLLTHQSGLGYDFLQPQLTRFSKYMEANGKAGIQPIPKMYLFPLLHEPGTSWSYGVGLDWVGQMIERVTNQTLGAYMEANIWKPLGMTSTTFRIQERSDIKSRRADMSMRIADGTLIPSPTRFVSDDLPDDHGGGGLFSCAADYMKLLVSVLKNDGTLLTSSSMEALFMPCLFPDGIKALRDNRAAIYKGFREGKIGSKAEKKVIQPYEMNHALGGQISERDWTNGRKAGSMNWSGLPNLSWFIDRKSGIALLYSSQLLPSSDHVTRVAFERFEYAVYNGELGDIGSLGS
ncbi:hypothetical protein UA08_01032 [Talaromyces atroroseus]|uniref:Beta-lactamase-related domain-containing protein n=1 Tax=Talaromyces atroroseus TaxID=1441469 RepID=A0A225B8G0_TALAT|nr:hypothetical protein UA08_01032 [Talaromyces atroroseus]OKL63686.1 hypothetical protein UA08_01032 [Talaromyces atroroseus]